MASPTEILKLIITGDSKGLKRALDESDSRVVGWSRKIGRNLKKVRVDFGNVKSAIATLGAAAAIRSLVRARFAVDSIESSLRVATGSATAAAAEFGFVRKEADRLGLELKSTASTYADLAAASRGTALEGQATRDIFLGVVEAMTALGRGAEATSGALTAVEQIISKGRVSAEELRGQMGERLPGAFQIAARAIGVTTEELDAMLVAGELTAEELLPALAQELRETFGPEAARRANSLRAELNRLQTTIFDLASSQDMSGFTDSVRDLRETLQDPEVQEGINTLLAGLVKLAEWAGEAATMFARLGETIGEEIARMVAGPDLLDQIIDLNRQITVLEQQLEQFRGAGEHITQPLREELAAAREELVRLEKQYADANFESILPGEGGDDTDVAAPSRGGTGRDEKVSDIDKYIAKLREELATTEETRAAVVRYELAQKGASETQILQAQLLAESIEMKKEDARIEQERAEQLRENIQADKELIEGLKEQIRLERMNNVEREQAVQVAKLSTDATEEQKQQVRELAAELSRLEDQQRESTDQMTEYSKQAARNMQDAFAEFLFDPFEEGLEGLFRDFIRILQRMIAEALAAQALQAIAGAFSSYSSTTTNNAGQVVATSTYHGGGLVHAGGGHRRVPAAAFAGAPKYHGGGAVGLRPDEVPLIGQVGEEMITTDDPRHRWNGGGQGGQPIRIVNTIQDDDIADSMNSSAGEKVILNVIRRNPEVVRNSR